VEPINQKDCGMEKRKMLSKILLLLILVMIYVPQLPPSPEPTQIPPPVGDIQGG